MTKPTHRSVLISAATLLMAFSLNAEEAPRPITSMDSIAQEHALPCESLLIELASNSLKLNPHRMLEQSTQISENELFGAFAVTDYRDRASHVTFHGVENTLGRCQATVTESYVLQTNCADARHEAFSKWDFQGKLSQETMVLSAKRISGKQAFLTDQKPAICLVTTRYTLNQP
ncbi:hypothetical protein QTV44_001962 [Vibrio vulnificus]|nr:hypothetical protein [Vibrio vulnificus]